MSVPRGDDGTLAECPLCEISLAGRSPPDHFAEYGEFERQWRDDDTVAPDGDGSTQTQLPVNG